ncbi:hypothetical protein [Prochlorococcus marinus]|nr:hypothetical protein [Prochlorococcus marinus]
MKTDNFECLSLPLNDIDYQKKCCEGCCEANIFLAFNFYSEENPFE